MYMMIALSSYRRTFSFCTMVACGITNSLRKSLHGVPTSACCKDVLDWVSTQGYGRLLPFRLIDFKQKICIMLCLVDLPRNIVGLSSLTPTGSPHRGPRDETGG